MLVPFLHGTIAMGCVIAGVFFLRFWQQSRDPLFMHFAAAFWILAASYVLLGTRPFATEGQVHVFVIRLLAFCMILYGIFEKNRR
jgi:Family of unknown function (DUF5985)